MSLTSSAFATRADLASWLNQSDTGNATALGAAEKHAPTPRMPAGHETVLPPITLPASIISGVDPKAQQVRGLAVRFSNSAGAQAIGRTAVVVNPAKVPSPVGISVVMPLTTPPATTGLISKAALTRYTAANGTLSQQLDGVLGHHNVAIGIDPRIIASIRALGTSAPPSATSWLRQLELAPNEIFPLSYGDADLAVQAQSGLKKLLTPTSLAYALNPADHPGAGNVGETQASSEAPGTSPAPTPTEPADTLPTLDHLLTWPYTPDDAGIAWPAENTVTTGDVAMFAASGLSSTILSSSNMTGNGQAATPPAIAQLGNGDVALISDSALSNSLRAAATATTQQAWG
ncbi:MAG: hypothetical protein ACRDTS_25050, partial [Mycobacterium sp.]